MQFFPWTTKLRLARSLLTKTAPAYVQFYVTSRCDLECEQCNIIYGHADCPEMSIVQIQKLAENLAEIGVCIVLLIGGEPFVRKDLPEVVQCFSNCGIHTRLQTNGLASRGMLEACVVAGAHDISISLDTLDPQLQDSINSRQGSWERAIKTISVVNAVFPANGTGFFGYVLMPKNYAHAVDVAEFASQIGWWISLVPVHVTSENVPRGFRCFSQDSACVFQESDYSKVHRVIEELKKRRQKGFNLYDADEYLEDVERFICKRPVRWRRKNFGLCDSPSLYFAIDPSGNMQPCCDYRLEKSFPVYDKMFPEWFRSGIIHDYVTAITQHCDGCMYGSYPEITVSARYLPEMIRRTRFFNFQTIGTLKPLSEEQLREKAAHIYQANAAFRESIENYQKL